jgi:hypothetical protein
VVLSALLCWGAIDGTIPVAIALTAFAMLFSAGAETAYGRSAAWRWVRRLGGGRSSRLVIEQYLGSLVVALLGALVASSTLVLARLDGIGSVLGALGSTAVLVASLCAIAYLAGVALPFDDGVPTAVVGTSVLALALESIVLWVGSLVARPGTVGAAAYDVAVAALALGVAIAVVDRRR